MRHYEVISGEYCSWYGSDLEPPEYEHDWGVFLARNAREAKKQAIRSKDFHHFVQDARGNGVNPFTGMIARPSVCSHGICWGCEGPDYEGCPACTIEDAVFDLGLAEGT